MTDIEKARAVAADLLRQAGDETGARVLERAVQLIKCAHGARVHLPWAFDTKQEAFDLCAYLDPEWAKAEVERARVQALEMHEAWKAIHEARTLDRWADRVAAWEDADGYLYRVYGGT